MLAHAKRLRVIAESNYKSDDIDAELLARMRLAGLIPEVHPRWHSSADDARPRGSRRHPQETPNPEELKRQAKD